MLQVLKLNNKINYVKQRASILQSNPKKKKLHIYGYHGQRIIAHILIKNMTKLDD
jgi:hypothetical protein